ncbi:ankyrin [Anaeromyces robustus]|uniref:Ankyrin n=1 Tax=Anaeromyces robustus TaxID=1754192 RepID=A0A1Y1W7N3_9FUNG|nr:ankyrin [Anaeromyces robustus]|eukprot:ORX69348.1 ankyrin [Anaeromyces robustus]
MIIHLYFLKCNGIDGGNKTIANYLIDHGVNINKENVCGETPLFQACYGGNEAIVRYLVKLGTDINKKTFNGNIPLHKACDTTHLNINIIKYLMDLRANIYKKMYMDDHH